MSGNEKDEEMIYALTADEHDALRQGLRALPETMPPRAVWHRIREQAEAEGLLSKPRSLRPSIGYTGGGIAAAAVLVAFLLPTFEGTPVTERPAENSYTTPESNVVADSDPQPTDLQTLQVESRKLEKDLRALPSEPKIKRAGTQATILELEDRIAAIDYQLSDPAIRLSEDETELFWRERVRLMKSLVELRYAQARRSAF